MSKDERFEELLKDCARKRERPQMDVKSIMQELAEDLEGEDTMEELSKEELLQALEICRKLAERE